MDGRTFVVGLDATDEGAAAINWARTALGDDDTIVAVHVWDVPTMVGLDESTSIPVDQLGSVAERGLVEYVDRFDDARVEPAIEQGHAGRALVRVADARDATAIAVGHRGAGRASLVLGSTANHVVHHTDRPVVVVRGDWAGTPQHLVVGIADRDAGSQGADASIRALRFAATNWPHARIDVVHAGAIDVAHRAIQLAELADDADVRAIATESEPTEALIAASADADLVVVGSRGRRRVAGLLLGSTSQGLLSNAGCPVAVVR